MPIRFFQCWLRAHCHTAAHMVQPALLLIVMALSVVACTAVTPSSPSPTAEPATVPQRLPQIVVAPDRGRPGAPVQVRGHGFLPSSAVDVRVAYSGKGPYRESFGRAITDKNGEVMLTFTVPEQWPDGELVSPGRIMIVLMPETGVSSEAVPFQIAG